MKQVWLSLIIIVVVASLAAVGTYTDFSDIETSQSNTFEVGSLDLQLGDTVPWPNDPNDPWGGALFWPDEDYGQDPLGDSVLGTWDRTLGYPDGMQPGDYLESQVKLRNAGSIEATRLDITCVNVNTAPPGGPLDKDAIMIITALTYHVNTSSIDLLQMLKDVTGKDTVSLDDWESNPITELTPPPLGQQAHLDMTVLFGPVGNEYQGCTTMMTLNFALLQ